MSTDRLITTQGFLEQFRQQHLHRQEKPFCFVLGAGASQMSKIPTGGELAMAWLRDLHHALDFKASPLESWATPENLGIPGFDLKKVASFYSQLYEKRFHDSAESGYAYLEDVMRDKEPSYGYSVLAYLLSETQHKIVITTNFDNLVADALSIHSTVFPLVVGHDSLAHYARVELRRPLIAKVHGGLGFAPKSNPDDLGCLTDGWCKALERIFERCSPIVIGYDGNDGSLMSFLQRMPDDSIDNLRWCFYAPDENMDANLARVPERVLQLVAAKRGRLVPIPGFDEIMLLIQKHMSPVMKMPDLRKRMRERAKRRYQLYSKQESELNERVSVKTKGARSTSSKQSTSDVNALLKHAMMELAAANKVKPWWQWQNEAVDASTVAERDEIYKRGITALPTSAELLGNYAVFLKNERKDMDKAEKFYMRAIKADPKQALNLGSYALFLLRERKQMDKAEEFFQSAIAADSKQATNLGNYASFLHIERKDPDTAEDFYRRAIEADPKDARNLANYANFLSVERNDLDQAEELYKRAIEANPKDATVLTIYGNFLRDERKDVDKAEEFYKRAIEADPKDANNLGNYAQLCLMKRRPEEGLQLLKRAGALKPEAAELKVELAFYHLAHDPAAWPSALAEMADLLASGARSPGWNLDGNVAAARESGHPNPDLLSAIADVISKGESLEILSRFAEWPKQAQKPKK